LQQQREDIMTIEELAKALPHGYTVIDTTRYACETGKRLRLVSVALTAYAGDRTIATLGLNDDGTVRSASVSYGVPFNEVPKVVRGLAC
jgi:hypothetical protein